MSNIQRFESWPQEWPMEDNDGDLVMYDDHVKIVRGLEVKLAKAVDVIVYILANAPDGDDHRWSQLLDDAAAMLIELKV
jgi:hypothetical protein